MIKTIEFLLILLVIIIFIKFHKNLRKSINIWIITLILVLFFDFLKRLNYDFNRVTKILNILTSNINLFFFIYTPIIIIVEGIRKKAKKCNNIFKVVIIDTIFGDVILFNLFFIITFIGLFQYRYNIMGPTISEGTSNIINTIQTIIVTFFISLNFNEGYIKYKDEKAWRKYYRTFCINSIINILYQFNVLINILLKYYIKEEESHIEDINSNFNDKYIEIELPKHTYHYKPLVEVLNEYKKMIEKNYNYEGKENLKPLIISTSEGKEIIEKLKSINNSFRMISTFISDNKTATKEKLIITELNYIFFDIESNNSNSCILITTSTIVRIIEKLNTLIIH